MQISTTPLLRAPLDWFWALIDRALRSRLAVPLFFLLLVEGIRRDTRAIQAFRLSTPVQPRLVSWLSEGKKRISLAEGFVPVKKIRHSSNQREPDADQFIVDAIREGGDSLASFLAGQELNTSKPYWTAAHSRERVAAINVLLQAEPETIVIWVAPTDDGQVEVVDGNHRLRVAQIRGLTEMKVIFFVNVPSIDWATPRLIFLNRLIDRDKPQTLQSLLKTNRL